MGNVRFIMKSSEPSSQGIRKKTLAGCSLVACIVLIPLCLAVSWIWPGESNYDTYGNVWNPRVKQCLPPGARDITVHTELNGHFARYKVSETDFHNFLNALWEAKSDRSAHQRDRMGGEGEPPKQERFAKRFEPFGWEPLKNAIKYHSPSKSSGAITEYYYDRDAGIAYHDTGYW